MLTLSTPLNYPLQLINKLNNLVRNSSWGHEVPLSSLIALKMCIFLIIDLNEK